jgi:hypothetical protein
MITAQSENGLPDPDTLAGELLTAYDHLPPAQQGRIRAHVNDRQAGPRARRDRADRRNEALHRLLEAERLPIHGRGAWRRIWGRLLALHPDLTLTRGLRRGETLDSAAPFWIHSHTITWPALRRGYRAWRQRNGAN